MNPSGLCECGCGGLTKISKYTSAPHGYVKGQPRRFIRNHQHRGKIVSIETRMKLRKGRLGKRRDNPSYRELHRRLTVDNPKSGLCDHCYKIGETEYALIKGHQYSELIEDYIELCPSCHRKYDFSERIRDNLGRWSIQA